MNNTETAKSLVNEYAQGAEKLALEIYNFAELNFREVKSAEATAKALEAEGFSITRKYCGINTAFCAEYSYGSGGVSIGYLGEYDALSGLSQKAATAQKCPVTEGAPGHGCGHNLLGAGSFAAAAALKKYIETNKINATVKYFGCPAEEDGGGKTHMAKAGAFDNLSAIFTWHPGNSSYVSGCGSLAVTGILYKFSGIASHAAATPFVGRSALDAAELMSVGCNYLREHIIPEARLHYAYRDVGGTAPNVVQASAAVHYYIRAPHVDEMLNIAKRVDDVARGAALMTGTNLNIQIIDGVSDYLPNKILSELLAECMQEVGAPSFDCNDRALAQQFEDTISPFEREENLTSDYKSINKGNDYFKGKLLDDSVAPLYYNAAYAQPGSTDVGDVSYCVPTAQCNYACFALGTGGHSWQMAAQAGSSIGIKGMLKAAEALCLAGIKSIASPQILASAKQELAHNAQGGYICPMPDGVNPEF
ncbi:MAG: amidohydrolase [Oscillospiraceae bacterium]